MVVTFEVIVSVIVTSLPDCWCQTTYPSLISDISLPDKGDFFLFLPFWCSQYHFYLAWMQHHLNVVILTFFLSQHTWVFSHPSWISLRNPLLIQYTSVRWGVCHALWIYVWYLKTGFLSVIVVLKLTWSRVLITCNKSHRSRVSHLIFT